MAGTQNINENVQQPVDCEMATKNSAIIFVNLGERISNSCKKNDQTLFFIALAFSLNILYFNFMTYIHKYCRC